MKSLNAFLTILALCLQHFSYSQTDSNRVLVISGGGSRGAWGGGVAQSLIEDSRYNYDVIIGTSTGSLLAPLVAAGEFEALKKGYTSITDKDIFNVRPYKTKGKKRGQLKPVQAFCRVLLGKKTLGESKNLKRTIRQFFKKDFYYKLKEMEKEVIVTVVNLSADEVEYKSSNAYEYDDMVDWMWASANVPVFMSTHVVKQGKGKNKTKTAYVDGGIKEGVPLRKGIEKACELDIDFIDVIVHHTFTPKEDTAQAGGIFKLLTRTIELFLTETRHNDLSAAKTQEGIIDVLNQSCGRSNGTVTITYYFMPEEDYNVISDELLFDKNDMTYLWEQGRSHINRKSPSSEMKGHCIQVEIPKEQLCGEDPIIFLKTAAKRK